MTEAQYPLRSKMERSHPALSANQARTTVTARGLSSNRLGQTNTLDRLSGQTLGACHLLEFDVFTIF